jgi:hypothetical protein
MKKDLNSLIEQALTNINNDRQNFHDLMQSTWSWGVSCVLVCIL